MRDTTRGPAMNRAVATAVGAALVLAAVLAAVAVSRGWLPGEPAGRVVTVGLYENRPKIYTDDDGQAAGLFADLLREIARKEHWSLRFVPCAWSRCLEEVAAGRIDLMPDVAYSDERRRRFDFPDVPVTYAWSQIYRAPTIQVRSIADLEGKRVAVLRSGIQQDFLAQWMAGAGLRYQSLPVDSLAEAFRAVRDGRADAAVSNSFFGGYHAREYGLVETPVMFEPVSLYFVTAKGRDPDLLAALDRHLGRWREDSDSLYFSALRRAMAPAPATVVPRSLRWALTLVAIAAVALLGFSLVLRWRIRRATRELDLAKRRLEQVLGASPVVLYLLRQDGARMTAEWISPNIERLFGFSPAQALAPGWWKQRVHPDDREAALAAYAQLAARGSVTREYRVFDGHGKVRHVRDQMQRIGEGSQGALQVVGTWSDLTESRQQAEQVDFLTRFDALTGLANRSALRQHLFDAVARAAEANHQLAVLCIDLDRFKNINDTLGHGEGDELLLVAARKLAAIATADDFLARIGGDRFVLVLGGNPSARRAFEIAQQVVSLFSSPNEVGAHRLIVTASVGVSLFPEDGEDADSMLKHAELALYDAKQRGRATARRFAAALASGALERLVMESELRGAAERGELVLHYQPQVDLRSGHLVGVEALVRWQHPEIGLVPPGRFIPLAEETGVINGIAAWVLEEACRQMVAWRAGGFAVPCVAVNLSTKQMEEQTLPAQVAAVLGRTGLDAGSLELEITESTIMREPEQAIAVLQGLKAQGVLLSIDDFGTGHSSLAYLKRLPLDRLKIDQSFVREIGRDSHDEAIGRAVIELARNLSLETVAEGVEREEQAAFLRAEGCEFAQGYLFSRPLPAAELRLAWQQRVASGVGAAPTAAD